ncbi:THAP domain-containing protein 1-like isoform X1 [Tachypleus tridentatus]|uniref:THAP domain-containing protein 1-like isoform X1 n=1 Tax=Tachypleus tridentatus TaxID=6853 RepID=UPI003FD62386
MVTTSVAVGCQDRQDRDPGKNFHRFSTDPGRRSRWIAAVKREGWQPTSASRVSSDHFILSKNDDFLSPDYVPLQFQYVSSSQKKKSQKSLWKHSTEDQPTKSEEDWCLRVKLTSFCCPCLLLLLLSTYCVEAADEQEGGPQIPDIVRVISI